MHGACTSMSKSTSKTQVSTQANAKLWENPKFNVKLQNLLQKNKMGEQYIKLDETLITWASTILWVSFSFEEAMASSYKMLSNVKNVYQNILTHRFKCVFNRLCTLFFIEGSVLKHHSSSTNLKICTIQISASLNHFDIFTVKSSLTPSHSHNCWRDCNPFSYPFLGSLCNCSSWSK
jgi:hypothetical protein